MKHMSNTDWSNNRIAPVAITVGEPAGIGPDLAVTLAQQPQSRDLVFITDPALLEQRARLLGLPAIIHEYRPGRPSCGRQQPGTLSVLPMRLKIPVEPGKPDSANAAHVLACLERAVSGCLEKEFAALVTGPVHKATINDAGYAFSGHTEFIAGLCGDAFPVMMLMNSSLRVALVTTHLPLARVPELITGERLEKVITTVARDLELKFRISGPRLLVCGLNPHAGERGYLGSEEMEIIEPALAALRKRQIHLTGPVPADTAFTADSLAGIDAVITMYHDQGLPVLKSQGFGEIINITLGLPIIRTSVDHGTAFSLAGTGKAGAGSFLAAIRCASELASPACAATPAA